jgi:hypothetical protein
MLPNTRLEDALNKTGKLPQRPRNEIAERNEEQWGKIKNENKVAMSPHSPTDVPHTWCQTSCHMKPSLNG